MNLLCRLGWHRADQLARWNNGYYFSKCVRCGQDLVRTAYERWHVPSGYRVVWQAKPPQGTDSVELASRPAAPSADWHHEMERSVQGAVQEADTVHDVQPSEAPPATEVAPPSEATAPPAEPAAPEPTAEAPTAEEVPEAAAAEREAAAPAEEAATAEEAPIAEAEAPEAEVADTSEAESAPAEAEAPELDTAEPEAEVEAPAPPANEPAAPQAGAPAAAEEAAPEPVRRSAASESELPILEVLRHLNDSEPAIAEPAAEPVEEPAEEETTEETPSLSAVDESVADQVPVPPVAEPPAPPRIPVEGDDDFMAVDEADPEWVEDIPTAAAAAEAARRRELPQPAQPQAAPILQPPPVPAVQEGPVEPHLPYDAPPPQASSAPQASAPAAAARVRRTARSTGELVSWIAIGVVVLIAFLVLVAAIASALDRGSERPAERPALAAPAAEAPRASGGEPVTQSPQSYEYITATFLNCRAAPSKESEAVRRFARGDRVGVLAKEGSWLSVAYRGRQCWAADKYISAERPL